MEIPTLEFLPNEIIEINPAAYQNEARRIPIPGLPALDARTGSGCSSRRSSSDDVGGAGGVEYPAPVERAAATSPPLPTAVATAGSGVMGSGRATPADDLRAVNSSPGIPSAGPGDGRARSHSHAHKTSLGTAEMVADKVDDED